MAKTTKKEDKIKSKEKLKGKITTPKAKSKAAENGEEKFYADEEQGILPEETEEETEEEMKEGKKAPDIYTKEGRDIMEKEDEFEPWEEGFMEGASGPGQLGKDALTGESLINADNVYELEFEGKLYRFVSEKNAEEFLKKRQKVQKQVKPEIG